MITVIGTGTGTGPGLSEGPGPGLSEGPGAGTRTGTGTGPAGAGPAAYGDERSHARALAEATLVVGARRHLDAAPVPSGAERIVLGPLAPALDAVAAHLAAPRTRKQDGRNGDTDQQADGDGDLADGFQIADDRFHQLSARPGEKATGPAHVVVLASGDPGFFGIVRALAERFGPSALRVLPSVPSVALAFARAGLSWDDAAVVSAHGRDPRTAVNVCRSHPKTAVLTGPACGPAELGAALAGTGIPRTLLVATALGTAGERLERLSPAEAAARAWPDPVSVVLCLDPARTVPAAQRALAGGHTPRDRGAQWALPEGEFEHRDSMVTKYEVRALALARLAPGPGDLIWDVGAGSGSVAVECARLGAAAVAVEQDADGVDRVRANAAAHGVYVQAVHGSAPGVLDGLPDPDAVFVGGGGRGLAGIVAACAARARRSVVVTLAALDRVPEVRAALSGAGLVTDGVLLNSARLSPLPGDVMRLAATNPVFVLWGTVPPDGHEPGSTPADSPANTPANSPEQNDTSEGAAP